MDNTVISIGRELGSGGKEIAEMLANRLGFKFYDRKLLEVAARESGFNTTVFENADERETNSFLGSIFSIHGSIANVISGGNCIDSDQIFSMQSETIRNIAEKENCVIVGRCAEYVLRNHPRMTSIFITANHEDRITYIMNHEGKSRDEAIETIDKGDKRRRQYHDYYATTRWGEARCYDICINASQLGLHGTTEFLYNYIKQRFGL